MRRECRSWPVLCCLAGIALAAPAWGQDPALRELQRNQQMRQQQQDELQLRMQQQQRDARSPPPDARRQQSIRQLEIDQRRRQQELHYRQNIEQLPAPGADDEGTRRAKAQIEQQHTRQESEQQLRRFEWELRQESERRR